MVVYRLTRAEKGEKLQEFGVLLSRLQATYTEKDSDQYGVMVRCVWRPIYGFIVV